MKRIQLLLSLFLLLQSLSCKNSNKPPKLVSDTTSKKQLPDNQRSPLLISTDCGQSWTDASQGLSPDIQVSFLEKIGEEIVIATDNKGLFISSYQRSKWTARGEELPHQKINALHVEEETIYVGVYRQGIFESTDKGLTWQALNYDLPQLNIQAIWKFDQKIFVGTDDGIFFLLPHQMSWTATPVTEQVLSIYDYNGKLVGGTHQGTILSEDRGTTWRWIRREGAVHYTHPIEDMIVELAINGDIALSNDWGKNWYEVAYKPKMGSYVYEIAKTENCLIMSNNYGIHRSFDRGKNWKLIYETESMGFFDFLVIGDKIYGGTRDWDEYRKRK